MMGKENLEGFGPPLYTFPPVPGGQAEEVDGCKLGAATPDVIYPKG